MPKNRGIDGKYKPQAGLSLAQKEAIVMLVHTDKTNKEIYEGLGVPASTFYDWFKQDLFDEEFKREKDKMFKAMSGKALKKLGKLIDGEDNRTALKAVENILKQDGYLTDKLDINQNTTTEIIVSLFNDEDNDFDDE